GPVDGVEVDRADRVDELPRDVAVHPDVGRPGAPLRIGQLVSVPGAEVPEVDEGVLHLRDDVAGQPGMGVAPVGGVQRADVVAADEGGVAVDDHQLAVIAAGVARMQEPPAAPTSGKRRTFTLSGKWKNERGTTRLANSSNTTYTSTPRSAASISAF